VFIRRGRRGTLCPHGQPAAPAATRAAAKTDPFERSAVAAGQTHGDPWVDSVAAFIDRRGLLARGQAVVAGVSGGADSVALLAVLRELADLPERAYRLTAAHLDHGLRDGSADDAEFVAQLAAGWGIPCLVERRDVSAAAAAGACGIEEAARRVRYEFLAEAAERSGATAVAVGHHADDNVETILYRIARGTHLRGLAGIPAKRALAGGAVELVRPLLAARREQIEAFCRRRALAWRTDRTNADTGYRRNFIRHEVLPLLRRGLNERVDDALLRLAAAASDAEAHLAARGAAAARRARREETPGTVALDADALAAEPPVVQAYALRTVLERLGVPMGRVTAERLAAATALLGSAPRAALDLPGGFAARRQGAELVIAPQPRGGPAPRWEARLACPGETPLPDGRIVRCTLRPIGEVDLPAHCASHDAGVEMLDAGQVRGALTCRPRRDGDAFVPLGLAGRQTVSDFLTNRKAPMPLRDQVVCVADEEGIVYVAPLRIAERVKVGVSTRNVLRIEVCPAGAEPCR